MDLFFTYQTATALSSLHPMCPWLLLPQPKAVDDICFLQFNSKTPMDKSRIQDWVFILHSADREASCASHVGCPKLVRGLMYTGQDTKSI